jgi:transcriptional regulator with XRE-family HTH domain
MLDIPKNEIDRHIGKRIQFGRKLHFDSDEKRLAEAVNMSLYKLKQYEEGRSSIPALTLNEIAKKLDVPFNYFFIGLE